MAQKRYKKAYKLVVTDTLIAKNNSGGTDVNIKNHHGNYYGDSRQDAIDWFKSTLTLNPVGTSRGPVVAYEIDLPERKDVWTRGFFIGFLVGFAFIMIYTLVVHLIAQYHV